MKARAVRFSEIAAHPRMSLSPKDYLEGCQGYRSGNPVDGYDFDCGYEFAGDVSCEVCIIGPYPDENSLDPRVRRDDDE